MITKYADIPLEMRLHVEDHLICRLQNRTNQHGITVYEFGYFIDEHSFGNSHAYLEIDHDNQTIFWRHFQPNMGVDMYEHPSGLLRKIHSYLPLKHTGKGLGTLAHVLALRSLRELEPEIEDYTVQHHGDYGSGEEYTITKSRTWHLRSMGVHSGMDFETYLSKSEESARKKGFKI